MNLRKNMSLFVVVVLVLSVMTVAGTGSPVAASEGDGEEKMVLVRDVEGTGDLSLMHDSGEVIDRYGMYVLLKIPENKIEWLEEDYEIDTLENRNELNVKGHEFNTNDGYPDFDPELMRDEYEDGEKGLYIVDMIGPVNPEWREKLENIGAKVINYQPNYAYEVLMTPEQAKSAEEMFFVDWVGIYQPGFKVADDIEPGEVVVSLEDTGASVIGELENIMDIHLIKDVQGNSRVEVLGEVEDESKFSEIAQINGVYFISNHYEPEITGERDTQTVGGGHWFYEPEDPPFRDDELDGWLAGKAGSYVNQLGYTGKDVVIAVADTGIYSHSDFQE